MSCPPTRDAFRTALRIYTPYIYLHMRTRTYVARRISLVAPDNGDRYRRRHACAPEHPPRFRSPRFACPPAMRCLVAWSRLSRTFVAPIDGFLRYRSILATVPVSKRSLHPMAISQRADHPRRELFYSRGTRWTVFAGSFSSDGTGLQLQSTKIS